MVLRVSRVVCLFFWGFINGFELARIRVLGGRWGVLGRAREGSRGNFGLHELHQKLHQPIPDAAFGEMNVRG
jgi:hypothetical protein